MYILFYFLLLKKDNIVLTTFIKISELFEFLFSLRNALILTFERHVFVDLKFTHSCLNKKKFPVLSLFFYVGEYSKAEYSTTESSTAEFNFFFNHYLPHDWVEALCGEEFKGYFYCF